MERQRPKNNEKTENNPPPALAGQKEKEPLKKKNTYIL